MCSKSLAHVSLMTKLRSPQVQQIFTRLLSQHPKPPKPPPTHPSVSACLENICVLPNLQILLLTPVNTSSAPVAFVQELGQRPLNLTLHLYHKVTTNYAIFIYSRKGLKKCSRTCQKLQDFFIDYRNIGVFLYFKKEHVQFLRGLSNDHHE